MPAGAAREHVPSGIVARSGGELDPASSRALSAQDRAWLEALDDLRTAGDYLAALDQPGALPGVLPLARALVAKLGVRSGEPGAEAKRALIGAQGNLPPETLDLIDRCRTSREEPVSPRRQSGRRDKKALAQLASRLRKMGIPGFKVKTVEVPGSNDGSFETRIILYPEDAFDADAAAEQGGDGTPWSPASESDPSRGSQEPQARRPRWLRRLLPNGKPRPARAPGVAAKAGSQVVPLADSFDALTGSHALATGHADQAYEGPLANEEAMIEQFAHGLVDQELDDEHERFLAANGYQAMPVLRGEHQFVMRTFLPTESGRPPIVAFRGTVPSKRQTVLADLDPSGIGMYQFVPNRALIEGQINAAAAHGRVISAGHSLGGALAQIAAASFSDRVSRVVTFQAPGVSRRMVRQLEKYNVAHFDEAITSSHHRVQGDLVHRAGEALTPGVIHNHRMTDGTRWERNPLFKHTALPLAQEELAAGHAVPVHGERRIVESGEVSTDDDNEHKSQFIEHLRKGVGHVVYGVGRFGSHH